MGGLDQLANQSLGEWDKAFSSQWEKGNRKGIFQGQCKERLVKWIYASYLVLQENILCSFRLTVTMYAISHVAGMGAMGISSSVGANTLNILLCLAMPWFIKCIVLIIQTGDATTSTVTIMSQGVMYNCFSLLSCAVLLYAVVAIFKFQIGKWLGFTCLIMYFIFITFSVLIEMNVFFYVNKPLCVEIWK